MNVLVETAWEREDVLGEVTESLFVSPGVRAAFDVGRVQVVPGLAVPIGVGAYRVAADAPAASVVKVDVPGDG